MGAVNGSVEEGSKDGFRLNSFVNRVIHTCQDRRGNEKFSENFFSQYMAERVQ